MLRVGGRRKAVQDGVRVKFPQGVTWQTLAQMTPDAIAEGALLPAGFMPLPPVKQSQGGQVFPNIEIDTIRDREARSLRRFDVDFDLPDYFTPQFPPRFISRRIPNWATYPRETCSPSRIIMH
jgi:hypothetical protein